MTTNQLQKKIQNQNVKNFRIKKFGIDGQLEIGNCKFMRVIIFIIALFLIELIGVGVGGVEAVRMVPGTVPTSTPLQPPPPDVYPNYQGNIEFKATGQNTEVDKPTLNQQDEIRSVDLVKTQPTESKNTGNGKLQFVIILVCGLVLIYAYVYFKKSLR